MTRPYPPQLTGAGRHARVALCLLATATILLLTAPVRAACVLDIRQLSTNQVWTGDGTSTYDVFTPTLYTEAVTFRLRKTGGSCDWFVAFSIGDAGSYAPRKLTRGGQQLDYNIYKDASLTVVLKDINDAAPSEVFSGSLGGGTINTDLTFYWSIPAQQIVKRKNSAYLDNITVTAYEGTLGGSATADDTKLIKPKATVVSQVEVCAVDKGAPFNSADTSQTLQFNNLVQGKNRTVDVRARTNDGFILSYTSANNQTLAHTSVAVPSNVPYDLEVKGSLVDLTSGAATVIATKTGTTGLEGNRYRTKATIGDITGTLAGAHQDNITITVTAN